MTNICNQLQGSPRTQLNDVTYEFNTRLNEYAKKTVL